jgi:xylan 1,4-beta-xylosidase
MAKLSGQGLTVESSADLGVETIMRDGVAPDVAGMATLAPGKLAILLWHYHDDDLSGADASIKLALSALPFTTGDARVTHYRIDDMHNNACAEWKRPGSPTVGIDRGSAELTFSLPRQAVSLLVVEWPTAR